MKKKRIVLHIILILLSLVFAYWSTGATEGLARWLWHESFWTHIF